MPIAASRPWRATALSRARAVPAAPLALAAALAAGCVDDPDAIYSAEGELVGGTASAARPEIGTFAYPTGPMSASSCTATLVGPRTVLTAAHCLSPAYTATAAPAGAVFQFVDATGAPQTIGVDRVHSFAAWRLEALPSLPFTTDVAILHLDRAVTAAEATPAAIAIQEPYAGDRSTIFGFGCQDRTPPAGGGGGGFKQFFTFIYPDATRALCAGDSGGPVVYGAETDGGAIWGVNSDWYVGWDIGSFFPDSWTDAFGDVPFYRRQIEAVVRGWDGIQEQGVDRPGLDYANPVVANVAVCRTTCQNDGNCRAYTFVPEGASGRCWMKSGVPEPVPGPGMTSGIAARLESTTNRGGGDYTTVAAASADACAASCGRDQGCAAFTFQSGSCRLKSTVPASSYCGNCTSGVPRRGLELGINRPGWDIATHTAVSARHCADLCAQHERCEAFTFTGAATGNCWLKDAVPNAAAQVGMTSGVRRGLEVNTDRAGSDYRSFAIGPSPAICQATCAREAQCQAWTYVPAQADLGSATCWLKSGVPAPRPAPRMVSGVKGLEMVN